MVVFLFSSSISVFAQNEVASIDNSYESKLNSLISDGLTTKEAETVLKFDEIRQKLEKNGQFLDVVNDEIVIDAKTDNSCLTRDELKFLSDDYKTRKNIKRITSEKRHADIEAFIKANPNIRNKRITYEDGSWIQVVNGVDEVNDGPVVNDDKIKTYIYIPNEVEVGYTSWYVNGKYTFFRELQEFSGVDFAKVFVSQDTFVSDYNNSNIVVRISNVIGGGSHTGITSMSTLTNTGTLQTSYSNPTDWTLAYTKGIFTLTVSHSVSFAGVYSFSVTTNSTWEQWVALKCSIAAAHAVTGYYGI
jgi:hypothetical protein